VCDPRLSHFYRTPTWQTDRQTDVEQTHDDSIYRAKRSSKVIDYVTNEKPMYDMNNSNYGPISHRFGDAAM